MRGFWTNTGKWIALGLATAALSACSGGGGGDAALPPPDVERPVGPPTPTPEPVSVSAETTEAQLEQFEFIWGQINETFPYEDFNGADWEELHKVYRTQIENGLREAGFQAAMEAMVSELADDGTYYLSPDALEEVLAEQDAAQNSQEGYIGTLVGMPDGTRSQMTILYVFPGSPAEVAGVLPHDVILGIDGEEVPFDVDDDILARIRGEIGTDVVLTLQSPGGDPRDLSVPRAPLGRSGVIEARVIDDHIGYIFIPPGTDESSLAVRISDVLRTFQQEENIDSLILDLRIARVSQQWPLDELLGLFTHGEAYELFNVSRTQPVEVTGKDVAGSQDLPLVVLIGHDTVGLSEIFAGSLQSLDRATVVGGATEGDVEIIFNVPVGEDALLVLSGASARGLDGEIWGRGGVQPEVRETLRWEQFTDEDDPQLQRAIDVLRSL